MELFKWIMVKKTVGMEVQYILLYVIFCFGGFYGTLTQHLSYSTESTFKIAKYAENISVVKYFGENLNHGRVGLTVNSILVNFYDMTVLSNMWTMTVV